MTPTTASVVWLDAPGKLALREEALAAPGDGQLLCATIVSAISPGTELAAYKGLPPLRPGNPYPRLQGYCNVAQVIESRAAGFEVGDRVLTFSSHRSHFVTSVDAVLLKLSPNADAGQAACSYLYHLGYNAVLRADVRAGHKVVVQGLGLLGLTSTAMAAIAGADVYAVSSHGAAAVRALSMAASGVFPRSEEAALVERLGPGGADVVITTVGGWDDWHAALRLAGPRGTIAVLGFPGRGEPVPSFNPLDSQYFYMKQLRIEAVGMSPELPDSRGFLRFNERANLAWIAGLIDTGLLDASLIISGRYPAARIEDAYRDLIARRDDPVTYLLDWNAA